MIDAEPTIKPRRPRMVPRPIRTANRSNHIIGKADWGWVEMYPSQDAGRDCWKDCYSEQTWLPDLWMPVPVEQE